MNNIPTEVYYHIFRYLSRPEVYTCSFVYRQWKVVAVQVYYKELIIDDYKIQMAKFNLTSDSASKYFKNGYLVRKLTLTSNFEGEIETYTTKKKGMSPSFSRYEFLLLIKYLPNIEEIDLTESGNFTEYISFLFEANLRRIKMIASLPLESCCYFDNGYRLYFFYLFQIS